MPSWKKWLSYVMELHVESTSSEYNPHLYVSLRKGRYQLSTAHAVYSFGDLYSNFARVFQRYNWKAHPVNEVLLLGLGLGSIPVILEQVHQRECHYTAVEIDEAVVDLAERYILHELHSPIQTICADARVVVEQLPAESYDLICVDIFDDDTVPEAFEQADFLHRIADLLRPQGVILFNRLAATAKDQQLSRAFFEEKFCAVFPDGDLIDVGGNYMLVNRTGAVL